MHAMAHGGVGDLDLDADGVVFQFQAALHAATVFMPGSLGQGRSPRA